MLILYNWVNNNNLKQCLWELQGRSGPGNVQHIASIQKGIAIDHSTVILFLLVSLCFPQQHLAQSLVH